MGHEPNQPNQLVLVGCWKPQHHCFGFRFHVRLARTSEAFWLSFLFPSIGNQPTQTHLGHAPSHQSPNQTNYSSCRFVGHQVSGKPDTVTPAPQASTALVRDVLGFATLPESLRSDSSEWGRGWGVVGSFFVSWYGSWGTPFFVGGGAGGGSRFFEYSMCFFLSTPWGGCRCFFWYSMCCCVWCVRGGTPFLFYFFCWGVVVPSSFFWGGLFFLVGTSMFGGFKGKPKDLHFGLLH